VIKFDSFKRKMESDSIKIVGPEETCAYRAVRIMNLPTLFFVFVLYFLFIDTVLGKLLK
tara:strand:+ start:9020 stop:9196 length:177 start_codon:yes stop_codon:yes gene_type:complete